jgi:GEVED domain/Secretion system C-terminal sorting domain
LSSTINGTSIRNFNISIPGTATPGSTRMRVVMRRSNGNVSPCITGYQGEAEDYNVNLIAGSNRIVSGNQIITSSDMTTTELTRVLVSPNPSFGLFNIVAPQGFIPVKYEVVNTAGNMVARKNLNEKSSFTVDLVNVPKGIYLLRMFDKQGAMQTTKLVVQ